MKPKASLFLVALLASPNLFAATSTWVGTTGGWGVAANWGGTLPTFGNTADVVFGTGPITTHGTFLGAEPRTVRSISVQGSLVSPLEIRTNDNGAVARMLVLSSDSGTAAINVASTITQPVTIGAVSGTGMDLGTIGLASNLLVTHNGTNTLTLRRPVNDNAASSGITKTGTGTLVLTAANGFTGEVSVTGGILKLGNVSALGGTSGNTSVSGTGTLDLAGFKTLAGETVSISGSGQGGIGALYQSTGNLADAASIADGLTLTGNATVGAAAGVRYGVGGTGSGGTNGLFTLTKVGAGQFDLRGDVYIGDIIVNEGALQTEGTSFYNFDHSLTVNAGAEFRLYNINNPFERQIYLNGGKINSTGSNAIGDTIYSFVTLNGACAVDSSGEAGDKITLGSDINESTPGSSLAIGGTQRVVLSANNTYTGATLVNSGTLEAAGNFTSSFTVATNATLAGEGVTTGSVTLADGSFLSFNPSTTGPLEFFRAADVITPGVVKVTTPNLVPGSAVILRDGNGGLNLANFTLVNAGRGTLSLGGTGGTSDLIFNFQASNLEWRALVDGVWNTQGTANFRNLGTLGDDLFYNRDNVDFTDAATGTVTLSGNIAAGDVVFKNTSGHNLVLAQTAAETLEATSLTTTASGQVMIGAPITGITPLTIGGGATVILTANNPSTGGIAVNNGTLQLGNGGTTGSTAATAITNDGAIITNRTDTITINTAISGSGTFTHSGTGTTTLTQANTYTGTTFVNAGLLQIGNTTTSGSISGNLQVTTNADFHRSDSVTYGGAISGTGTITKRGTGTLTLTGTNNFSGGLNIYNGVTIAGDANLGTGPITMGPGLTNAGTLSLTGSTDNEFFFSNGGTGNKIVNLAAGTLDATMSGTIHLDANATTNGGVSRISPAAGTLVIAGKMTGLGVAGYSKRNPGTVVISNTTNDYAGPTHIIDPGLLLVDGKVPGNVFFGEALGLGGTGAQNGTLGGSGTIAGNVKVQAASNLSPGGTSSGGVNTDTHATLTILGILDVSAFGTGTGRIVTQLGALAGPNDRINVGGGFSIGSGTLGLSDFSFSSPGGLQAGAYTLVSATGGITGTLDPANLTGEIIPGFNGTLSISGNDLVLTVSGGGDPYAAWAAGYPGLTNPAFAFDFDGDGIPTGLEWILGGNPTVGDVPGIAPVVTGSAGAGLTLSFRREEDSIGVATLVVEYGNTLTGWTGSVTVGATSSAADANGVVVTIDDVADPDNVTVAIPATNAASGKLFARLKATKP